MLEVKNISCGYDKIDIIKDATFQAKRGEVLCIVGPNGCGKSTLLKAIGKLIEYKGKIALDSNDIKNLSVKEFAKNIALMTQSNNIYFPYTVYETVALGRYAYLKGILSSLSKEDNLIVMKSIKSVGLIDLKDKLINELSGGQLQRVFLAKSFAQNPEVILLDEPTNHLDLKCQIEILEYLSLWAKENNKIIIAVLHDLNLVNLFGEKVILLSKGEIISKGTPKEVFLKDNLKNVYNIDVKNFMINALKQWQ
ncbi:ABC transporter ATP-binding protein [Clostridium saccharobutylicum]|uniref:Iron(3+)-hydroxamate import ATP-binding protein FhuC n=1 Tax=Clostridium saccharobutylicum DSM 13864 TaxID=1345695 RepID=U5MUF5_CLOSA|nr:ABC transporter ATP-binding protein [Clostridium saccharobutylicum]AGX44235.1 iron(3+)-hydroxamate import ATP-binding protein FhuC [Clostridium saccharobutylicum DSM 13864]AQR91524.1 putative siderophore transport system ATP-binding protein YusV [Clostridium saccharobutylicum]AQS01429.1 putative siderophore transport system ATP-binding protein YusV [Clostridium saccharobutylicum]AQS11038.1 putative siderophore transport system ATP-binding protein YusV [Clostridium saccharobutylicum]AQS15412